MKFPDSLTCFLNSIEGVPIYDGHLLAAFPSLSGPTHPLKKKKNYNFSLIRKSVERHNLYWSTKLISSIYASRTNGFQKHTFTEVCPSLTGRVDFSSKKIIIRLIAFLLNFCQNFSPSATGNLAQA